MQAKLLAAIQNHEVTPLGESRPVPVDVRLICATNKNLRELVQQGEFREDLLYRINTIEITLPPLRERGNDILLIANHDLQKFATKYGKPNLTLGAKAAEQLLQHPWPGNVRELKHAMIHLATRFVGSEMVINTTIVENLRYAQFMLGGLFFGIIVSWMLFRKKTIK